MRATKIIRIRNHFHASGDYGSPVHLIPKKEPGMHRITGNFQMLNIQAIPYKYAIPLHTDFVDFMSGATFFSSLDWYKSSHQIEVAKENRHETAILTPFGSYAFKKMPMGLTLSGNTFQHLMNKSFERAGVCVHLHKQHFNLFEEL